MFLNTTQLNVIKYCAEECERQGSGEPSVYDMVNAWNWMTIKSMRKLLLILTASLLIGCGGSMYGSIPKCPEDSLIVGWGEFDDGRWTNYRCGPARDD